jgi:hypothetical protein
MTRRCVRPLGSDDFPELMRLEMKQSELSRAERREDHLLSTLRRYVEGLGGELQVVARVGDKVVKLRGV